MPLVQGTGAHVVAAQKVAHLQQRLPVERGVLHLQRHAVGRCVRVLGLLLQDGLLFLLQFDAADVAYGKA